MVFFFFWSCKSLWNDLGSVDFTGWMESCFFFWAFFCVGFIIKCLLLSKSFSNTKGKFCPWDISICQKSLTRSWKLGKVCVYILREAKPKKWEKETLGKQAHGELCVFKGNCCVRTWYASLLPLDRFTVERHKLNSFSCSFEAKSVWLVQPLNDV